MTLCGAFSILGAAEPSRRKLGLGGLWACQTAEGLVPMRGVMVKAQSQDARGWGDQWAQQPEPPRSMVLLSMRRHKAWLEPLSTNTTLII